MLDEVLNEHLIKTTSREEDKMIRINPVNFNNNYKQITFTEGNLNNITPDVAILSLQNPNAKINFENDLNRSRKADMVQSSNMISAIGAKLRKTYNILFSPDYNAGRRDQHISYLG